MAEKTYSVLMSVLDKTAAPILAMEERLKKLGMAGAAAQKKLTMPPSQKLWSEITGHVGEARKAFSEFGGTLGEFGNRAAEVLPMLGALGGAASVAGLVELVHATAEAEEALHNVAMITGIAVPALQSLDFAAKQSGIGTDQLGTAIEKLNVNIGKAADGQAKPVAALFKEMGINLRDANGHVKTAAQLLPQIENSFKNTADPAVRAAMAVALFGKAGEAMIPFLAQGNVTIAALQAKFDKFGYKFSDEDQEGLEQFNDSWKDAQLAVSGFGDAISAKLAPVLAPLLEEFASFVAKNRDWIALDVAKAVKELGSDFEHLDIKSIAEDFEGVVAAAGHFVDDLGGLQNVLVGAGAVMTLSFLAPVIELTAQFGALGGSILLFGARAAGIAGYAADFAGLIPEIKGVSGAMAAFDLAADANPLGALILALGVLGGLAYAVWKNFDRLDASIASIEKKLPSVFTGKSQGHYVPGGRGRVWVPDAPSAAGEAAASPGGHYAPDGRGRMWVPDPAAPPRLQMIKPSAATASMTAHKGTVDVNVNINGAPPGSTASAVSSGTAAKPSVRLGGNGTMKNHMPGDN